ncbi:hypothetical protein BC628DRAFT_507162 [Trametes gibbosa]|nr:hypothetical protein BC628DRAFT_507162 [Trametes gibbosa]
MAPWSKPPVRHPWKTVYHKPGYDYDRERPRLAMGGQHIELTLVPTHSTKFDSAKFVRGLQDEPTVDWHEGHVVRTGGGAVRLRGGVGTRGTPTLVAENGQRASERSQHVGLIATPPWLDQPHAMTPAVQRTLSPTRQRPPQDTMTPQSRKVCERNSPVTTTEGPWCDKHSCGSNCAGAAWLGFHTEGAAWN